MQKNTPKNLSIMKIMKYRILLTLGLILLALSACSGNVESTPQPEPTLPSISFEYFQEGNFVAVVPGWERTNELDPESIYMVQQEGQFVGINRYKNLPEIFATQFKAYIEDDPNAYLVREDELDGKPFFEFTTREDDQTLRVQAILNYCQGQTYALITGGRDTVENADLFQHVLASSTCQDSYNVPSLQVGKIGLMVNPSQDDFWEGYYPAIRLAKENGVQVLHSYLLWGEVEPTEGERVWEWQDALMGYRLHEGFEISLVVNLIHTSLRGPMPEDLADMDFDDPEFIERFSTFMLEVLDRYPVQYLSIGNEVNDYFISHRDEIPAYRTFFLAVKDRIQQEYPDVKVAMTFAYHDAERTNSLDIIDELNLGDFLPLTLYLYSPPFNFDRDPFELERYFERILDLAGETPLAFAEIGWNTAETLSGSEQDQAEFVREAFRLLSINRDRIEFMAWFNMHDIDLETASQSALSFIPANAPLIQDQVFMRDFVDFLTYLGLRESDGTPKPGWFAFIEESERYLAAFQE
jgi:hypothetical protein